MIEGDDRAIFASDMHLGEHDAASAEFFLDALSQISSTSSSLRPSHLFLLGDLFELWVGDDDHSQAPAQRLQAILSELSKQRCKVWIMGGNRDFLLGEPMSNIASWVALCDANLLSDPCKITLFGQPTVLTHGDLLCTKDSAYQTFRVSIRDPQMIDSLLKKPLAQRRALGAEVRVTSEHDKQGKPMAWMDAQEAAILSMLKEHQALQMIHGHTHLPQLHKHSVKLAAQADWQEALRWVLSDWQAGSESPKIAQRGAFLCFDQQGARWINPKRKTEPV